MRPGALRTWRALTSITFSAPSSRKWNGFQYAAVDSITTHVTRSAIRCSRNARMLLAIDVHVVTVDDVALRPRP